MIEALRAADRRVAQIETLAALATVIALVFLVAAPLAVRPLLKRETFRAKAPGATTSLERFNDGAGELTRYLMLWLSLIGASLATQKRGHITIDAVTKNLPLGGKAVASLVANCLGACLTLFLAYAGVVYVHHDYAIWAARGVASAYQSKVLGIPEWCVKVAIPYGLAVMAWRFLIHALEDARAVARGDEKLLQVYAGHGAAPAPPPPEEKGA